MLSEFKCLLLFQANVMLEYDIDEAQALLEKNLSTATRNLDSLEEDLDFLRDQFTTTEVSILSEGKNLLRLLHNFFPTFLKKEVYLVLFYLLSVSKGVETLSQAAKMDHVSQVWCEEGVT